MHKSFIKFTDICKWLDEKGHANDELVKTHIFEDEAILSDVKIGQTVIEAVKKLNIDLRNCVSISTDGNFTRFSEANGRWSRSNP